MSETPVDDQAESERADGLAEDDGSGDEENAGRVTISDEDPERARRIAAAMAVDSDEAPPVPS